MVDKALALANGVIHLAVGSSVILISSKSTALNAAIEPNEVSTVMFAHAARFTEEASFYKYC